MVLYGVRKACGCRFWNKNRCIIHRMVNGKGLKNGTTLAAYPQIGERGQAAGKLSWCSFCKQRKGSLHDDEFSKPSTLLKRWDKNGYPDADKATETWLFYAVTICTEELSIVRLSVSLYCLTGIALCVWNVPLILTSQLADGDYNPTETIYGKFQVLECKTVKEQ